MSGRLARSHTGRRAGTHRLGTRGRPEESRAAILKAAVAEFAEHGIAGARTDAIARAAHVNKALLYYLGIDAPDVSSAEQLGQNCEGGKVVEDTWLARTRGPRRGRGQFERPQDLE